MTPVELWIGFQPGGNLAKGWWDVLPRDIDALIPDYLPRIGVDYRSAPGGHWHVVDTDKFREWLIGLGRWSPEEIAALDPYILLANLG